MKYLSFYLWLCVALPIFSGIIFFIVRYPKRRKKEIDEEIKINYYKRFGDPS